MPNTIINPGTEEERTLSTEDELEAMCVGFYMMAHAYALTTTHTAWQAHISVWNRLSHGGCQRVMRVLQDLGQPVSMEAGSLFPRKEASDG